MTSRSFCALVLLLLAAAGCGQDRRPEPTDTAPTGPPASEGYNADQLTQALLTDIPGYEHSGVSQSGQYGTLTSVRNALQMQQAAKLDKPECASSTRAVSSNKDVWSAPAAFVAFAKGRDQTVSEILMAVGPDVAAQQVGLRVPASCRSFRASVGGRWSTGSIVEARGARIGEATRTVGVATTTGAATVKTWYVVLRSRGYLAAITLFGPNATRDEAENLARQAYQQAERILP
ncbi:hypothetical protein NE235_17895 [Actinoallomurus spadix]|uniref:hypothetical protein n=1 Tax=Actinoallomurus spadix TaxID=79912 RepID=UPI002092F1F7|nr:hypothetical protein [Actinoallomurus spadix]MCO5987977.1 hypothetical protein [Actinoallomurus spadix]